MRTAVGGLRSEIVKSVREHHHLAVGALGALRDSSHSVFERETGGNHRTEIQPTGGDHADDVGEVLVAGVALRSEELGAAHLERFQIHGHPLGSPADVYCFAKLYPADDVFPFKITSSERIGMQVIQIAAEQHHACARLAFRFRVRARSFWGVRGL